MIFYYPKKNDFFQTLDLATSYLSEGKYFPRFSISIYDDPDFVYARQSINGQQILSIIDSDLNFSFGGISASESNNYVNGIADVSKTFYLKILLNQAIPSEIISEPSEYFTLSATMTLGNSVIKYYPVTCIEQNSLYTMYSATITFVNSDFKTYSDGNVYLNLVSDYNFSLEFPILISASNASFSGISSNVNVGIQTLASASSSQYFNVQNYSLSYGYSSNYSQFSFEPFFYSTPTTIFSTSPNIISFGTSGALVKMSFSESVLISSLEYFGFTITNTNASFNAKENAAYTLIMITNLGNIYRIESCTILNNLTNGYYNVVFKFGNISFQEEYVNYFLLEIQPISSNGIYTITFLSYLNTNNSNYTAFILSDNYTLNCFKEKIFFSDLSSHEVLHSRSKVAILNNILKITDNNYEIVTDVHNLIIPQGSFILTKNGFKPVESLNANSIIESENGPVRILKINKTEKESSILSFEDSSDYILNGVYIKNPLYFKNYNKIILPEKASEKTTIFINDSPIQCSKSDKIIAKNIVLEEKKINTIKYIQNDYKKIYFNFFCEENVFVSYGKERKKFLSSDNQIILKIDSSVDSFTIKSYSPIKIMRLVIS